MSHLWWSIFLQQKQPGLFDFQTLPVNYCSADIANERIRTWVLWCQKRPLYQLCRNHCSCVPNFCWQQREFLCREHYFSFHSDQNFTLESGLKSIKASIYNSRGKNSLSSFKRSADWPFKCNVLLSTATFCIARTFSPVGVNIEEI